MYVTLLEKSDFTGPIQVVPELTPFAGPYFLQTCDFIFVIMKYFNIIDAYNFRKFMST